VDKFWTFALVVYAIGVGCSQSLMSAGGTLISLASLWGLLFKLPKESYSKKLCLLVAAWVFYSFVNHLIRGWSPYTSEALKNMPLFLVLIYPLVGLKPKEHSLALIFSFYSVAVLASVLYSSYQFFYLKYYGMGFFHNQIYFAYNLLPGFFFFSELSVKERRIDFWKPLYSRILVAIIFLGIFTTNNRMSSLIVFLYILFRALPWVYRRWGAKTLALVSLLLFGFFIAIYFLNPFVYDKISQTMMGLKDVSVKSRLFAWTENWKLFLEHPFFGVGFSNNALDSSNFTDFQGHLILFPIAPFPLQKMFSCYL
jgi:O-antigen ligase